MIIDGRAMAREILDGVKESVAVGAAGGRAAPARPPRLTIITACPNFETQKYLALKKRKAASVGIQTNVIELLDDCDTAGVVATVKAAVEHSDGIVVQLPLPANIDTNAVLAAIPLSHDVDAIHYDGEGDVLPPVVGAIAEIATQHQVSFQVKNVAIIGAGRLVGAPAALWAAGQGATVSIITKDTDETIKEDTLSNADIIISGAGVPSLITPDMIKDGVAIFDAGTSEDGGALVGDADPSCADKASLFTPVPGGIGPLTIACLLKNLLTLSRQ